MNIDSVVIILEKIVFTFMAIVGWCFDHIFLILGIVLGYLTAKQYFKHRKIQKLKQEDKKNGKPTERTD